jgi:hypothetical protein
MATCLHAGEARALTVCPFQLMMPPQIEDLLAMLGRPPPPLRLVAAASTSSCDIGGGVRPSAADGALAFPGVAGVLSPSPAAAAAARCSSSRARLRCCSSLSQSEASASSADGLSVGSLFSSALTKSKAAGDSRSHASPSKTGSSHWMAVMQPATSPGGAGGGAMNG